MADEDHIENTTMLIEDIIIIFVKYQTKALQISLNRYTYTCCRNVHDKKKMTIENVVFDVSSSNINVIHGDIKEPSPGRVKISTIKW